MKRSLHLNCARIRRLLRPSVAESFCIIEIDFRLKLFTLFTVGLGSYMLPSRKAPGTTFREPKVQRTRELLTGKRLQRRSSGLTVFARSDPKCQGSQARTSGRPKTRGIRFVGHLVVRKRPRCLNEIRRSGALLSLKTPGGLDLSGKPFGNQRSAGWDMKVIRKAHRSPSVTRE